MAYHLFVFRPELALPFLQLAWLNYGVHRQQELSEERYKECEVDVARLGFRLSQRVKVKNPLEFFQLLLVQRVKHLFVFGPHTEFLTDGDDKPTHDFAAIL